MVSLMMPSWQGTGAVGQTTCRQASSLNINDITGADVTRVGPNQWNVVFHLNINRHRMECPGAPIIPCSVPDKWTFKSSIAINIDEVENTDGGCRSIWLVTASSPSGDVFFGFKIRFEEDVQINGQQFNPRRKLGLVPLPRDAELFQTVELNGHLIDAGDDGDDN